MTSHTRGFDPAFLTATTSSFSAFLTDHAPELLPTAPATLPTDTQTPLPHGTTIVAVAFDGGVVMAGDRRATSGNLIANRTIDKVFVADESSLVGISGVAGVATEMVALFQVELEHYEKIEGTPLSLEGRANRLRTMIRGNLPLALRGLGVVPLFAGYDGHTGRIFSYDVAGGCYEEHDYAGVGSGSLFARGALKKLWHPTLDADTALRIAVEALYDAADDDTATGGPDIARRLWPTCALADNDGARLVADNDIADIVETLVADRRHNPGGAR
ncbi:proteasome beta subunit [Austwickia chelonae]|uniref:Proteasome subunit beta n=1 Tax=Austwickia chelonae NBRC 105200 TaxID=1184607 RepID=K6ULD6_9MICO|nr:proteasome subunit beta [Austwickia chelonae]GAB77156.1 20S proteasome beta-subunit [Austwickia chelonae NBRC 105200]SEW04058.1 proteasome beta subunit [Austwickia chelonae]